MFSGSDHGREMPVLRRQKSTVALPTTCVDPRPAVRRVEAGSPTVDKRYATGAGDALGLVHGLVNPILLGPVADRHAERDQYGIGSRSVPVRDPVPASVRRSGQRDAMAVGRT